MEQIRARIREKRGVDYTEQQIRELAAVKLEKFLDPRGVRSDLLEQFRRAQPPYAPPELPNYAFEEQTLFESHRGAAAVDPHAAAADPEAVLQPEPADPGAAHPVAVQHDERRARGDARARGRVRPAALRGAAQPGARDDADGHRGQEPEDARRVADEPARVQRAARAGARKRRRLQAGGRTIASARPRRPPPVAVASREPAAAGTRAAPVPRRWPGSAAGASRRRGSRAAQPAGAAVDADGAAAGPASAAVMGGQRASAIRRRRRPPEPPRTGATSVGRATARRAEPLEHGEPTSASRRRRSTPDSDAGDPDPTSSEARGRRPALRPGDQRRRRAARALHRRASRAPRRGRGADDLRHRLRHLAERAARRASNGSTACRCAGSAVKHERDPLEFGRRSERVFEQPHSIADELDWLDAEGPSQPGARRLHREARRELRLSASSSAIATTTRITARARPASRAILVPTAERDSAIGLSIFTPIFRGVRALMYNSPEERAMIQARRRQSGRARRSWSASARTCPPNPQPARFRQKFNIRGPFAVYVGRIDENKGCKELFEFFEAYLRERRGPAVARAGRQLAAADSRASAHPPPRLPRRHRQVRRDGGRRAADHAVVLREPVDGGARGVGARQAGAGQRASATC